MAVENVFDRCYCRGDMVGTESKVGGRFFVGLCRRSLLQSLTGEPHSPRSLHHFNVESIGSGSLNEWNHVGYPAASVYLKLIVLLLLFPITLRLYFPPPPRFITLLFFLFFSLPPSPPLSYCAYSVTSIFHPILIG